MVYQKIQSLKDWMIIPKVHKAEQYYSSLKQ